LIVSGRIPEGITKGALAEKFTSVAGTLFELGVIPAVFPKTVFSLQPDLQTPAQVTETGWLPEQQVASTEEPLPMPMDEHQHPETSALPAFRCPPGLLRPPASTVVLQELDQQILRSFDLPPPPRI
jgi:hypothetical protein